MNGSKIQKHKVASVLNTIDNAMQQRIFERCKGFHNFTPKKDFNTFNTF